MSGVDLRRGRGARSGPSGRPWSSAGARRGSPVLSQEGLVLGLGLDAGGGSSHLPVNGHYLVLHQTADLQVLL